VAAVAETTAVRLNGELATAVANLDTGIREWDDQALSDLADAESALATARAAYETKAAVADRVLAEIEAQPAAVAETLARALVRREDALRLGAEAAALRADGAQASADGKGLEAAVAYLDFRAKRAALDPAAVESDAALLGRWTTARNEQLSALADLLQAETLAVRRQLELATKQAEIGAKLATRDADAAARIEATLAGGGSGGGTGSGGAGTGGAGGGGAGSGGTGGSGAGTEGTGGAGTESGGAGGAGTGGTGGGP
jgi:hypothetical protein